MMLRLLEMTYADLTTVFAEHFGKGPFLAGALYREFYKQLNPQAWKAAAIARSPGLPDRLVGPHSARIGPSLPQPTVWTTFQVLAQADFAGTDTLTA